MNNEVKKYIAKEIAETYYNMLLDGFEEQKDSFKLTLSIIEFISRLKEDNIKFDYRLDNILGEPLIDLMYLEVKSFIGRRK